MKIRINTMDESGRKNRKRKNEYDAQFHMKVDKGLFMIIAHMIKILLFIR